MANLLWSQTWLVVMLGMASVFAFLFIVVLGLRAMSYFTNPAARSGEKASGK